MLEDPRGLALRPSLDMELFIVGWRRFESPLSLKLQLSDRNGTRSSLEAIVREADSPAEDKICPQSIQMTPSGSWMWCLISFDSADQAGLRWLAANKSMHDLPRGQQPHG